MPAVHRCCQMPAVHRCCQMPAVLRCCQMPAVHCCCQMPAVHCCCQMPAVHCCCQCQLSIHAYSAWPLCGSVRCCFGRWIPSFDFDRVAHRSLPALSVLMITILILVICFSALMYGCYWPGCRSNHRCTLGAKIISHATLGVNDFDSQSENSCSHPLHLLSQHSASSAPHLSLV